MPFSIEDLRKMMGADLGPGTLPKSKPAAEYTVSDLRTAVSGSPKVRPAKKSIPSPDKDDDYEILGGFTTFAKGLTLLPRQVAAKALTALQGPDGASVADRGWADRFIDAAGEDADRFAEDVSKEYKRGKFLPGISIRDVAELPQNLAYSGVTAATGLGVGVPIASVSGPGGWIAGMGATGTAAYRMAGYEIMQEYLEAKDEAMFKNRGRHLAPDEENQLKKDFAGKAARHGLWEAIPEALGSAVGLKIITAPLKKIVGKSLALRIGGKLTALYGEELATETITEMGQQQVRHEAGLPGGKETDWTSGEDWLQALKAIAPQTFLLTTVMGGTVGAGSHVYTKKIDEPRTSTMVQAAVAEDRIQDIPDDHLDNIYAQASDLSKKRKDDSGLAGAVASLEEELQRRKDIRRKPPAATGMPSAGDAVKDVAQEPVRQAQEKERSDQARKDKIEGEAEEMLSGILAEEEAMQEELDAQAEEEAEVAAAEPILPETEPAAESQPSPGIVPADNQWSMTPGDIVTEWHAAMEYVGSIEQQNAPRIQALKDELKGMKGQRGKEHTARRKEINQEVESLGAVHRSVHAHYDNGFIDEGLKLREQAEARARERGLEDEESLVDFLDEFTMEISGQRPYIEYNYNIPVEQIFEQVLQDYLGAPAVAAEGTGVATEAAAAETPEADQPEQVFQAEVVSSSPGPPGKWDTVIRIKGRKKKGWQQLHKSKDLHFTQSSRGARAEDGTYESFLVDPKLNIVVHLSGYTDQDEAKNDAHAVDMGQSNLTVEGLEKKKKSAVEVMTGVKSKAKKGTPGEREAEYKDKELWEFTLDDFVRIKPVDKFRGVMTKDDFWRGLHSESVRQAFEQGDAVPAEVLKDYPDLTKPKREKGPETKKEKALREYQEYVAGLTDAEREAAGDLVIEHPAFALQQKQKIEKKLAEKAEKPTKTAVEVVTGVKVKEKKEPVAEQAEESNKIIPFKERPGTEKRKIEAYNKKMDSEEWVKAYENEKDMEHFTKDEGHSPLADELLRDLERDGLKKDAAILEIGSGQGRDSIYLAKKGHVVNGIDVSGKAVNIANETAKGQTATFEVGDAENLYQFENESQDAVYSVAALHGTPIKFTLKEIFRVLKPGGQAKLFLYTKTKTGEKWVSYWTPGEIKQYAEENGFKIEKFREGHDSEPVEIPGVSGKVEQETHLVVTTLRKPKAKEKVPTLEEGIEFLGEDELRKKIGQFVDYRSDLHNERTDKFKAAKKWDELKAENKKTSAILAMDKIANRTYKGMLEKLRALPKWIRADFSQYLSLFPQEAPEAKVKPTAGITTDDLLAEWDKQAAEMDKKPEKAPVTYSVGDEVAFFSRKDNAMLRGYVERVVPPDGKMLSIRGVNGLTYDVNSADPDNAVSLVEAAKPQKAAPKKKADIDEKLTKPAKKVILKAKAKETTDHIKSAFAGLKKINDIFGEEGAVGDLDPKKWEQIRPILHEVWDDLMAAGKSAKEFVAIVLKELKPSGRPYFEKWAREELEAAKSRTSGKEVQDEHSADGSTSKRPLAEDQSGDISADGRGPGARKGERSGGESDDKGDGDLDADRDDGTRSLAGEPPPIHIQDGEPDGGGLPAGPPPGEVDQTTPASEPRTITLSGNNPGNYRITAEDDIGGGTRGQKIDRNMTAIRLVKKLVEEGRYPTKAEQSVLAKYVGWGGLKKVWDKTGKAPQDIRAREELEQVLTKDEYLQAFLSITDAHYTSPEIISSIYDVLKHMGFGGGNVLEPTYGVGSFIGMMPADLSASSKWYGSELDPITAKIGQFLYPDAQLIESGFQVAEFPYGKFDIAIGNPPFGDLRIADTNKNRSAINRFKIHNYVITKEGMHLKPGGILANVVTTRFLDTANPEARSFLAKNFKFLGAIRLPNDAFAKTAGTQVSTDLIFLQKLMPGEKAEPNADWLATGATMKNSTGETVTLNKYFANNPDMMLGEPSMKGTMYGDKEEFTLNRREGDDVASLVQSLIKNQLAGIKDVVKKSTDRSDAAAISLEINREDVGVGGFYEEGGKIYIRGDDDSYGNPTYAVLTPETQWTAKTVLGSKRYARIKGMLRLRAKTYKLVEAERFGLPGIERLRKELNKAYNIFVRKHGFLSGPGNFRLMADDIKIEFGLESSYKKEITKTRAQALGIKPMAATAEKAAILKQRIFFPDKEITYAKDAADGYSISLTQRGRLDVDYIAKLTGGKVDDITAELSDLGLVFQDPETGTWIQEDEYLSGNVKAKYKAAVEKGLEKNAAALKKVFPKDKHADNIYAAVGATWMPKSVYDAFGEFIGISGASITISHDTGKVFVARGVSAQNDVNVEWQNQDYGVEQLYNAALQKKTLVAYDGSGDNREVNRERTKGLAVIVKSLRNTFADWLFADKARSDLVVKEFNDKQNTHAKRKYSGKHLRIVGASPAVDLRKTQMDAAWRMIQSPIVLLDHTVGAGKTFTIIAGIMERVRMGLTNKALVVVPNHIVGQWASDWMKLYPGANILAATNKDFSKQNRRRLFSRITAGKHDAVIVGHSSFGFIPIERESIRTLVQEEVSHLQRAEAEARAAGEKRTASGLAKRIQKKRERIVELMNKPRDNVTHFEQMGIDYLVVDESQEFKNLEYSSAMQNVTGMGNPTGSKRAFDLYSKIRWLNTQKNFGITFATGTPISNSLVEMYALLRYLNRQGLIDRRLEAFDAWAGAYAVTENVIEYTASQRLKDRVVMTTFKNANQLLQLYEEFADSVTMPDLKRIYAEQVRESNRLTGRKDREAFPVPKVKKGERQLNIGDPDAGQVEYTDYLVARALRLEELGRENDPRVDNHLWLMSDARKMALDIRLVDPTARPGKNNKIKRAAKKIKATYLKWNAEKGTQLVFCDLSTPLQASLGGAKKFIKAASKIARVDKDAAIQSMLDGMESYWDRWKYLSHRIEAEIEAISESSKAETDAFRVRRESLENFLNTKATDADTAVLTTADSNFSVYDDLKATLIRRGIPAGEIRFIHEANTPTQKDELFGMVNAGAVRVLIGSTPKMGAGTNVQERVVGEIHMDAPWRPSDVEQREGRIVRQGNMLYDRDPDGFEVEITAFSTSKTFDAVMWQILARKQGMLDDFRNGSDTVEDRANDSASYADFMAETTGNPAFKEKFKLEEEVEELSAVQRRVQTRRFSAEQSLAWSEDRRAESKADIERWEKVDKKLEGTKGDTFTFEGNEYVNDIDEAEDKERARIKALNDAAAEEHAPIKAKVDEEIERIWEEAQKGLTAEELDDTTKIDDLRKETQKEYRRLLKAAGIKEHPKTSQYDRNKIAKKEPAGATAGAVNILKEIKVLAGESDGVVDFQVGDVDVRVSVELTDRKKKESDFKFYVDDVYVDAKHDSTTFFFHDLENLLSGGKIRSILKQKIQSAKSSIAYYERSDVESRRTLERLQFKDDEKLAAKRKRYDEVVGEVNALEAQMAADREEKINKYIAADVERFGDGSGYFRSSSGEAAQVERTGLSPDDAKSPASGPELTESQVEEKRKKLLADLRKDVAKLFEMEEGDVFADEDEEIKPSVAAIIDYAKTEAEGRVDEYEIEEEEMLDALDELKENYLFKEHALDYPRVIGGHPQFALGKKGGKVLPGSLLPLKEIQAMFPGQVVGLAADGSGAVWVRTKSGHGLLIKSVRKIEPKDKEEAGLFQEALDAAYGEMEQDGRMISGRYQEGEIVLQRDLADRWTLAHESVHWMEDAGILTNRDIAALKTRIRQLHKNNKFTTENPDDIGGKEDRAVYIAQELERRAQHKGDIRRILNKVWDWVQGLINLVKRTGGGVVRDVESGAVYEKAQLQKEVPAVIRQSPVYPLYALVRQEQPPSGTEVARDVAEDRSFVNRIFELSNTAVHNVSTAVTQLQRRVQELAGAPSRKKIHLGIGYHPKLKRSRASDQLDRAMLLWRDMQADPDKLDEFRTWAESGLADGSIKEEFGGEFVLYVKKVLKDLAVVENLTDEQKAFTEEMGERFDDAFAVAKRSKIIRTHRDNYVRRLWKLPEGKEDQYSGSGPGYGFKTYTTAAKQRTFETVFEGIMNGYQLRVEGLTGSYARYMTELATVMANKAFIARGVATKDADGNALFTTSKRAGYAPLKASGFQVWRWAGHAATEVHVPEEDALAINTYGRKFFATPPERIPEMWAVYKKEESKRPVMAFLSEKEAQEYADEEGYERIEHQHAMDVSDMFEKQPLYAPTPLATMINKMTATDELFNTTPAAKALLRLNASLKGWILLSSFFHHLAGARSWIFGVRHGWKNVNPVKAYKAGLDKIEDLHPLIELGVKNGLTLGELQDWAEHELRESKGLVETLAGRLGLEKVAGAIETGRFYRERFTDSLFKKFFAGLKAEAFVVEYTHELQKANEKHSAGVAEAPDPDAIAERVARLINADFGGLHLGRMGRNPTLQKMARLLLLAPDWTESNFRTVSGMIPGLNQAIDRLIGNVPGPEGMETIYRHFWGRVILRIAFMTIMAQVLLNGSDETEEFLNEQMMSNRFNKLRWTEIDITKLYGMLGVDTEGRRKTFSIGGHFFDPLKLIDPWRLIKAKGSPATRVAGAVMSGSDWAGRPFTGARELAATKKTVKKSAYQETEGAFDRLPATVVNQVTNMQPIQVAHLIRYMQGEEDGLTALMHSMGAATHTAFRPRIETPVIRKKTGPDPVYNAISDLVNRDVLKMGPPSKSVVINGISTRMTPAQYYEYMEKSSAIVRRKLAGEVRGGGWQKMSDRRRIKLINSVVRNARRRIRGRIKKQMSKRRKAA